MEKLTILTQKDGRKIYINPKETDPNDFVDCDTVKYEEFILIPAKAVISKKVSVNLTYEIYD